MSRAEEHRQKLAEALREVCDRLGLHGDYLEADLADALLPVVQRIADEAAAEALHVPADDVECDTESCDYDAYEAYEEERLEAQHQADLQREHGRNRRHDSAG